MLSIPPATITSASPSAMAWAASTTAFSPEPQALFTVKLGTSFGTPPSSVATRPGLRPSPRREHVAEDHLVDLRGLEPGAAHRLADHDAAQPGGGCLRQGAAQRADGGARRAHDDGCRHESSSLESPQCNTARRGA